MCGEKVNFSQCINVDWMCVLMVENYTWNFRVINDGRTNRHHPPYRGFAWEIREAESKREEAGDESLIKIRKL